MIMNMTSVMLFYTRTRACLCNKLFPIQATCRTTKLEQKYKTSWLKSLLLLGFIDLDFQGQGQIKLKNSDFIMPVFSWENTQPLG